MKSYYLHKQICTLLLVFIFFSSCNGQNKDQPLSSSNAQTTYSKEVEEQINLVENNLAGKVKIEGEHWNISDRMAYYKFNGLSIAVIQNYKLVWRKE